MNELMTALTEALNQYLEGALTAKQCVAKQVVALHAYEVTPVAPTKEGTL